jgi:hypothetical protein
MRKAHIDGSANPRDNILTKPKGPADHYKLTREHLFHTTNPMMHTSRGVTELGDA